jgi:hypothetical protein
MAYVKTAELTADLAVEMRTKIIDPNEMVCLSLLALPDRLCLSSSDSSKQSDEEEMLNHHHHYHGHSVGVQNNPHRGKLAYVAPVAWMIIFGDGLHNFIGISARPFERADKSTTT